jgi:hypothetical protein
MLVLIQKGFMKWTVEMGSGAMVHDIYTKFHDDRYTLSSISKVIT